MAKFLATIKAIITRLVFASHGFIAIWQVTTFKRNPYFWYLSCPILLLFFEGIFTLTIKENQEWKWYVSCRKYCYVFTSFNYVKYDEIKNC